MKRIPWFFSLVFLTALVLSACQTTAQSPPTTTPTSTATLHPTPSCPSASSFGKFWENDPQNYKQVPVNYPFQWFYSIQGVFPGNAEAWANLCVPSSYTLVFSSGPDYTDEISVPVSSPSINPDPAKMTISWILPDALEPMKFYRWVVIGDYDNIHIWYGKPGTLHDDSKWPPNSTMFNMGSFLLAPLCPPDGVETPILDYPADGAVISENDPLFSWHYSDCAPGSTTLQVSVLPNLDSLPVGFYSSADADYTFQHESITPFWEYQLTSAYHWPPLPDCSTVYWRAAGRINLENEGRIVHSDWSETRSFTVNSGICPTPTSPFSQNPTSYAPYIITLPSSTPKPTEKPADTPKPTDPPKPTSPPPASCSEYTSKGECEDHSQCKWVDDDPTQAPYCTNEP